MGGAKQRRDIHCASYGAVSVSKRVSINISSLRDLCVQETCSENKNFDLCYTENYGPGGRRPSAHRPAEPQELVSTRFCLLQHKVISNHSLHFHRLSIEQRGCEACAHSCFPGCRC